jgi:3-hydroxyisobutyrate dehydrogenase-like beta-hydroxyacid dehydrogenase
VRGRPRRARLEPQPRQGQPAGALGATIHDSAADAVPQADIVVCMLESGPVIEDVLFRRARPRPCARHAVHRHGLDPAARSARPRGPAGRTRRRAARCARVGRHGRRREAARWPSWSAARREDFARALPVFHFGRATHVGPHGAGELAKLANQMIVGITIGAVAEALLLCAKGGADMGKVREAITGGFADSRILQLHGQRMVERDFAPRAAHRIQLKDMRNALATAEEIGFDAPITALFEQLYAEATETRPDGPGPLGLVRRTGVSRNGMS